MVVFDGFGAFGAFIYLLGFILGICVLVQGGSGLRVWGWWVWLLLLFSARGFISLGVWWVW